MAIFLQCPSLRVLLELKNQYYFPVAAAALLSCKFYHFPQLQFTKGDQSWALQDEGRGLKEKVTQTHKFSSLKRPFGVVGILLSSSRQSKMHLNVLFNRNIVWGVVLQGRVWFSLFCMCYVGVSQSSENKPIWYGCYLSDSFVIHSTLSKESFFLPLFFRSSFVSASSIVHF